MSADLRLVSGRVLQCSGGERENRRTSLFIGVRIVSSVPKTRSLRFLIVSQLNFSVEWSSDGIGYVSTGPLQLQISWAQTPPSTDRCATTTIIRSVVLPRLLSFTRTTVRVQCFLARYVFDQRHFLSIRECRWEKWSLWRPTLLKRFISQLRNCFTEKRCTDRSDISWIWSISSFSDLCASKKREQHDLSKETGETVRFSDWTLDIVSVTSVALPLHYVSTWLLCLVVAVHQWTQWDQ